MQVELNDPQRLLAVQLLVVVLVVATTATAAALSLRPPTASLIDTALGKLGAWPSVTVDGTLTADAAPVQPQAATAADAAARVSMSRSTDVLLRSTDARAESATGPGLGLVVDPKDRPLGVSVANLTCTPGVTTITYRSAFDRVDPAPAAEPASCAAMSVRLSEPAGQEAARRAAGDVLGTGRADVGRGRAGWVCWPHQARRPPRSARRLPAGCVMSVTVTNVGLSVRSGLFTPLANDVPVMAQQLTLLPRMVSRFSTSIPAAVLVAYVNGQPRVSAEFKTDAL
jgi:hypothetical protein